MAWIDEVGIAQYERILEQHGDLEDLTLRTFCGLYNSGNYRQAAKYAVTNREYVKRRWMPHPDRDIQQSAQKLIDLCNELETDAKTTLKTGILAS
jgi:hypothetical protein